MDFLTDWLTNWLKELLIGGIMGNHASCPIRTCLLNWLNGVSVRSIAKEKAANNTI